MKNKPLFKTIVKIALVSLVLSMSLFQFQVLPAQAAALTSMSDTMSRLKISTSSSHTIKFTTPTGAGDAADTIIITFPADFNFTGKTISTVTFTHGAITGLESTETLAASPSATVWGAVFSDTQNRVFTLTAPTDGIGTAEVLANDKIIITYNDTNSVNASAAGSKLIAISGAFGDSGSLAVPIVDSDQVTISATIDPTITFDLDTSIIDEEISAPYSVALGTLAAGAVTTSENSAVKSIFVDLSTNAVGGAVVTVLDANTGLASVGASKTIASATASLVAGTEGYGICVTTTGLTGLTRVAPFASTCDTTTGHDVGGLTTSAQNILNSGSAPVSGGDAEILVKAAISVLTPAAADYTDTLTFIATGTF